MTNSKEYVLNHPVKKNWTSMSSEAPNHPPHRDYYDYEVIAETDTMLAFYNATAQLVIVFETANGSV